MLNEEDLKKEADAAIYNARGEVIVRRSKGETGDIVLNLSDISPLLKEQVHDNEVLQCLEKRGDIKRIYKPNYDSFIVLNEEI